MSKLVWKLWPPPKIRIFSWLAIRNRLWTSNRLAKRGRNNCGLCSLCKQINELAAQFFLHCCYTKRLWGLVKDWLGLDIVRTNEWIHDISLKSWWSRMSLATSNRKAMSSLTMLITWAIWKKHNARVFNNSFLSPIILDIIKGEAKLWISAGTKHLRVILLENNTCWCILFVELCHVMTFLLN
jgi:hypothetical protein